MVYSLATDNSKFQLTVFDSVREEEKTGEKKKGNKRRRFFSCIGSQFLIVCSSNF